MTNSSTANSYDVICPQCGKTGKVSNTSHKIRCSCGNVFSYKEPAIQDMVFEKFEIAPVKAEPPKEPEAKSNKKPEQTFVCGNCNNAVEKNQEQCRKCGWKLIWG